MKAVQVIQFGGPDVLQVADVPAPEASEGQALVIVEAIGLGFVDIMMRSGKYPGMTPGFIPGAELVGTVTATGPNVDTSLVGKRVFALLGTGACAEKVVVDAKALIRVPDGIAPEDVVATGLNALVAYFGIRKLRLENGERVLIRGASGGIGVMAVQLAKLQGATVIASSSSGDRLEGLGASSCVSRTAEEIDQVDAVFDPVGGNEIQAFIGKLREEGRYLLCGAVTGFPSPDFGSALIANFTKSLSFANQSLNSVKPAQVAAALSDIFAMVKDGRLKPIISAVTNLEGVAESHIAIEAGRVFGKIVAVPGHR